MSSNRKPNRRYARYCLECGWGFTSAQLRQSRFCPRCGTSVHPTGSSPGNNNPGRIEFLPERNRCASVNGRPAEVQKPAPRNGSKGSRRDGSRAGAESREEKVEFGKVTRMEPEPKRSHLREVCDLVTAAPVMAGTIAAGGGLLAMAAGTALTAVGLAIHGVGTTFCTVACIIGGLGMFAGALGGDGKALGAGATIAMCGGLIGGAIATAGALVAGIGGALTVGGGAIAIGGGTVAGGTLAYRGAKLCSGKLRERKALAEFRRGVAASTSKPFKALPEGRVTGFN